MTARQERFISEYLIDSNGTQAAIRAGYSAKTANEQAARLLANVSVARAIEEYRARLAIKAELTAVRVLEELRRLAFVDYRSFYKEDGQPKSLSELTPDQGAALMSAEVILKNTAAGDGVIDRVHKIRLWDKEKALEMLAKYFGLLVERVEHSGEIKHVVDRLTAARQRVKKQDAG